MALDETNALTTWEKAQEFLGASDEEQEYVEDIINAASARANKETKRLLLARDLTEYYNGNGGQILPLRQWPINSVSSLYLDSAREFDSSSLVEESLYLIDPDSETFLVLEGTVLPVGYRTVKVSYNAGYASDDIPYDLEESVLELVAYWYKEFSDKRIGVSNRSQESRQTSYTHLIPKDIHNTFFNYRSLWVL